MSQSVDDIFDEIDRLIGIENGKTWREKKRKSRRVTVVRVDRVNGLVRVKGYKMEWWRSVRELCASYERLHQESNQPPT